MTMRMQMTWVAVTRVAVTKAEMTRWDR
jgi:hypothetical protein